MRFMSRLIGKKKVKITGIQITVGERRSDSEALFYVSWQDLIEPFQGFQIESSFCWIVQGKRGQEEVEKVTKKLRNGDILIRPQHTTDWVSVEQVYRELGDKLRKIRPSSWMDARGSDERGGRDDTRGDDAHSGEGTGGPGVWQHARPGVFHVT
jgi:hypothetical protein